MRLSNFEFNRNLLEIGQHVSARPYDSARSNDSFVFNIYDV